MSAKITWIGLEDLKKALFELPADLTADAVPIVTDAADAAAVAIRAAYPEGETGNLRRGVKVSSAGAKTSHTVRRVVRSTAPHATLFEAGTKVRYTKAGAHRGFMPGANIFVPTVVARRRVMQMDLLRVIEDAGLEVRGR